jgi:hypothetical protein
VTSIPPLAFSAVITPYSSRTIFTPTLVDFQCLHCTKVILPFSGAANQPRRQLRQRDSQAPNSLASVFTTPGLRVFPSPHFSIPHSLRGVGPYGPYGPEVAFPIPHSVFFSMIGHGHTQTVKSFIKSVSVWVCSSLNCSRIPTSRFPYFILFRFPHSQFHLPSGA